MSPDSWLPGCKPGCTSASDSWSEATTSCAPSLETSRATGPPTNWAEYCGAVPAMTREGPLNTRRSRPPSPGATTSTVTLALRSANGSSAPTGATHNTRTTGRTPAKDLASFDRYDVLVARLDPIVDVKGSRSVSGNDTHTSEPHPYHRPGSVLDLAGPPAVRSCRRPPEGSTTRNLQRHAGCQVALVRDRLRMARFLRDKHGPRSGPRHVDDIRIRNLDIGTVIDVFLMPIG